MYIGKQIDAKHFVAMFHFRICFEERVWIYIQKGRLWTYTVKWQ